MFQIKCADCECLPSECKVSKSAKACPNCTWEECCCYNPIEKGRDILANDLSIIESEWIQTPLREFGYKCIENKHELCKGCKCLCHFGDGVPN